MSILDQKCLALAGLVCFLEGARTTTTAPAESPWLLCVCTPTPREARNSLCVLTDGQHIRNYFNYLQGYYLGKLCSSCMCFCSAE